MEIWKPVKDIFFKDYYEVSNKGRLRSIERTITISDPRGSYDRFVESKILTLRKGVHAPHYFTDFAIRIDGELHRMTAYPHKLVAEVFLTNPDNKPFVSHKSDDYTDNTPNNLYWSTQSEVSKETMRKYPELKNQLRDINIKSGYYKGKRK